MSTEKRKPEDTICPYLTAAMIIAGYHLDADVDADETSGDAKVMCLGRKCHMYNVNDRKCGLRHR